MFMFTFMSLGNQHMQNNLDMGLQPKSGAAQLKREQERSDDTAAATKAASASIYTVFNFQAPPNTGGAPSEKINIRGHNQSIPPNNSQIYSLLVTIMLQCMRCRTEQPAGQTDRPSHCPFLTSGQFLCQTIRHNLTTINTVRMKDKEQSSAISYSKTAWINVLCQSKYAKYER